MNLYKDDYVAHVWCYSLPWALWSVWTIRKANQPGWDVVLTWDDRKPDGRTFFETPIHSVPMCDLDENLVFTQAEIVVSMLELQKRGKRLALITIKSKDPKVIVDKVYDIAKTNDQLAFRITTHDSSAPTVT